MSLTESPANNLSLTIKSAAALLIDLDGTLIDSMPCLESTYFDFLDHFGKTGNTAEFSELTGPPLTVVVTKLRDRYGLEQDARSLLSLYHKLMEGNYNLCQPVAGARDLLSAARENHKKLALVTGAHNDIVEALLKRLDWSSCFDAVITGESCAEHKPSPLPYLKALEALGLDSGDCLVIDDSANGIRSATAAGVASLGICLASDRQDLLGAGASDCFENLYSLAELIRQAWETDR
ncbi:MAG: HAD family phosphatase [Candidatus Melainabacteria bacterium]|nr:HAD family phosphatase [Candidatus Melainabacteria bacterium]